MTETLHKPRDIRKPINVINGIGTWTGRGLPLSALDDASLLRDRAPASRSFHPQDPGTSQSVFSEPPSLWDLSTCIYRRRVLIYLIYLCLLLGIGLVIDLFEPAGTKAIRAKIPDSHSGGLLSSSTLLFSHLSRASILQSWALMGQVA